MVLDTSAVLAALDPDERRHEDCARILRLGQGPLFLSPFVLAELDYLVRWNRGLDDELALLGQVATAAFRLEVFDAVRVSRAEAVLRRYPDQSLGLADASVVVLAEEHGTNDVFTLDERHFRSVRTADGQPFRLLPADV